jgi:membrane dipeptidase
MAVAFATNTVVADFCVPFIDLGHDRSRKLSALDRFSASGVDFVSLTVGIDSCDIYQTLALLAQERRYFLDNPDRYVLISGVADIRRAKAEGKLAVGFHLQGSNSLVGNANLVDIFYQLGIRHMLLAYNYRTLAGDGCHERTDSGLSTYGLKLVAEMNRVGMLVDLSHTGHRTSLDIIEASQAPVIVSHGNARALRDHPRNMDDAVIVGCARKGGVIGVTGVNFYLPDGSCSTDSLLRQIGYYCELIGPEHVGIGLDFVYDMDALFGHFEQQAVLAGGGTTFDRNMRIATPEQFPELAEGMVALGLSETDIQGILGENWLRVAEQVWK